MNTQPNRELFVTAVYNNDPFEIQRLQPLVNTSFLFRQLKLEKSVHDLSLFVPFLSPSEWLGHLEHAVEQGHLQMVEMLLPFGDPSARANAALERAAAAGQMECLKILLPLSSLNTPSNWNALIVAAYWGQLECVRYLIDHIDPCAHNEKALRKAVEYVVEQKGNMECVDFLLPHCNAHVALQTLLENGEDTVEAVKILHNLVCRQERAHLQNEIGDAGSHSLKRKM